MKFEVARRLFTPSDYDFLYHSWSGVFSLHEVDVVGAIDELVYGFFGRIQAMFEGSPRDLLMRLRKKEALKGQGFFC